MAQSLCSRCYINPVGGINFKCPQCLALEAIENQNRLIQEQSNAIASATYAEDDLNQDVPLVFNDGSYNWLGIVYGAVILGILFVGLRGFWRFWSGA